jgi:hypothetical protein
MSLMNIIPLLIQFSIISDFPLCLMKLLFVAEWKQILKKEESIMTQVHVSFFNTPIYLNSQNLNNQISKNIYKNLLNSHNVSIP